MSKILEDWATMSMPVQKPGRSKQDYGTPIELIRAVEARWDALRVDLAATEENAKCGEYLSPDDDSLRCDWAPWIGDGLAWLNPPFADISPWVERCAKYSDHNIILLVPASIGAEWFARHAEKKAKIVGLRPRLTFEGCKDPYPKDTMLCLYGPMFRDLPDFSTWRWKR